jgi:cell division transport system permease protein
MSAASVATLASCLFMVTVSFCLAANLDYLLLQMEGMMSITVFLEDDMPPEEIDSLIAQVNEIPYITNLEFIPSDIALNQFRDSMEDSAHIFDGFERNSPLPDSLVLDLDSMSNWDIVANLLVELGDDNIEVIQRGRRTAIAVVTINNVLRVIGTIIIIGLGIISVVIIFNTIRIAVNNRKTEIGIMKYVGATDAFIRGPFIVEGMIIGVLGALIPLGIVYVAYNPAMVFLHESLPVMMDFSFRTDAYMFSLLTPLLLIVGLLIGIIGSSFSIRRYLNV